MRKIKSIRNYILIISSIFIMSFSVLIILSCGAGVDVGGLSVYTLTITSDGYGSTTPSGAVQVNHGEFIQIVDTPDTGYNFVEWKIISGTGVIFGDSGQDSTTTTVKLTEGNATLQATHDTGPEIEITQEGSPISSGGEFDFGIALTGSQEDITFTIENNGVGDLILSGSLKVGLVGSGAFTVTSQPISPIVPDKTSDFTISFTPSGSEEHIATVTILSNDANEGSFEFYIRGKGITKLTAGDGAASDEFGYAVSISGNYAIVGAKGDESGKGAAYIFKQSGGVWSQHRKLTADDGAVGDYFGYSVAISGDYAIVGAIGIGSSAGAAYIFYKDQVSADNWGQQAKLVASDGATSDFFGWSVSISGDYAIIGANQHNSNAGAAYLFKRSGSTWGTGDIPSEENKKLTASDSGADKYFGCSVSISGSYVVIGSYGDGNNLTGAAYIFYKDQGTTDAWGQQAKLAANDAAVYDTFGIAVALEGDIAVVGAEGDDSLKGSAYIFMRSGSTWGTGGSPSNESKKIIAGDPADGDRFGNRVAVSGDYVVVGARQDDDKGTDSGSAYLFGRNEGGVDQWGEVSKLTAIDGATQDDFGNSVSISGTYIIIGSHQDDDKGDKSGSAYIYNRTLLE
jgi:hypothetical protein